MTVFFGKNYDAAVYQEDWRRLLALARWARIWKMPILDERALRTARKFMPEREKLIYGVVSREGAKLASEDTEHRVPTARPAPNERTSFEEGEGPARAISEDMTSKTEDVTDVED